MMIQSGHNFAHATTAQLSWQVQNFDLIGPEEGWKQKEFLKDLDYKHKNSLKNWLPGLLIIQQRIVYMKQSKWVVILYHTKKKKKNGPGYNLNELIKAWGKWLPFGSQHFQILIFEWYLVFFCFVFFHKFQ